jgi:cyclopropane fatty-acyl-phospholipid synthase-like methyltransferase
MPHADFIRQFYGSRVSALFAGRGHYEVLAWSSREAQQQRFAVLEKILRENYPHSAPALLDVGCGLADLAMYLESRVKVDYTGVDLTPNMIAAAKREHPGATWNLRAGDVFAEPPLFASRSFDVVFETGIFNLRMDNNEAFAIGALKKMMALANDWVVANFLHARAQTQYVECFYFLPERLVAGAQSPEWEIAIIDDYFEDDFTVACKRKKAAGD